MIVWAPPHRFPANGYVGNARIFEGSFARAYFAFGIATERGDVPVSGTMTCSFGEDEIGAGGLTFDLAARTVSGWAEPFCDGVLEGRFFRPTAGQRRGPGKGRRPRLEWNHDRGVRGMREHSGRPGVKEGLKAMPFGSLGDIPAATAILDRFLAHATIVQMNRQELPEQGTNRNAEIPRSQRPIVSVEEHTREFPRVERRLRSRALANPKIGCPCSNSGKCGSPHVLKRLQVFHPWQLSARGCAGVADDCASSA
jgi:hypothetical protein